MSRVLAVAINTFREAVRDRVLYGMLGAALLFELFALALGEMALDQGHRVVLDIGMAALSFFAVLVAVFLGSSLLYKEIDRRTLYVILPKPLRRGEFLLGKYVGIVLSAVVFVALTAALQILVAALQNGLSVGLVCGSVLALLAGLVLVSRLVRDRTAIVVPWSLSVFAVALWLASQTALQLQPVMAATALVVGEVLLLTAVALLFSAFSTPFLTGLLTTGVWLVGRSADTMANMRSRALPESIKQSLGVLAQVWPNFHLFVPGRHTLTQQLAEHAGPWTYTGTTLLYGLCYAALLLVCSIGIFERRDFL